MKTLLNISAKLRSEKGVVLVYVAILLVVFLGMAALAVDVGYLMVSKNELQNAADAAALTGASYLYPQISVASPSPPAWGTATTQATNAIGLNKSSGTALTDGTVQTGYWNLAHTPYGLQGTGITPGPQDCAAVQVAVSRSAGHNSGPVQHWFAPVIGISTSDLSAVATAAMCSPGTALPGALVPIGIPKWIADKADKYNSPSKILTIQSSYHIDGAPGAVTDAVGGQWTSLTENAINNASHLKNLITNGNPNPLEVGDPIYIEPGTMAVGFHDDYIGLYLGKDILLPIVDAVLRDAVKQVPAPPITGFICFHMTKLNKNKGIEGYFVPNCYAGRTNGNGPNYGAYAPPRLVQ